MRRLAFALLVAAIACRHGGLALPGAPSLDPKEEAEPRDWLRELLGTPRWVHRGPEKVLGARGDESLAFRLRPDGGLEVTVRSLWTPGVDAFLARTAPAKESEQAFDASLHGSVLSFGQRRASIALHVRTHEGTTERLLLYGAAIRLHGNRWYSLRENGAIALEILYAFDRDPFTAASGNVHVRLRRDRALVCDATFETEQSALVPESHSWRVRVRDRAGTSVLPDVQRYESPMPRYTYIDDRPPEDYVATR